MSTKPDRFELQIHPKLYKALRETALRHDLTAAQITRYAINRTLHDLALANPDDRDETLRQIKTYNLLAIESD